MKILRAALAALMLWTVGAHAEGLRMSDHAIDSLRAIITDNCGAPFSSETCNDVDIIARTLYMQTSGEQLATLHMIYATLSHANDLPPGPMRVLASVEALIMAFEKELEE